MKRNNLVPGVCRLMSALALALLVASCSTTGLSEDAVQSGSGSVAGEGSARAGATGRAASAPRRGGGYYLDDGPGDSPPPNLDAIPDAVPRHEAVLPRTTRAYTVFGRQYQPMSKLQPYKARGIATWYGRRYHGNRTSSGEPYDMYAMTAAHPTLPIPSYVRVTNVANGRSVVVRVNDRGPFLDNRLIDLSYTAASRLDYVQDGSAEVEVELITEFGERPLVAQAGKAAKSSSAPGTSSAAGAASALQPGTTSLAGTTAQVSVSESTPVAAPLRVNAPPAGGEPVLAGEPGQAGQAGLSAVAYSVPSPPTADSRAGGGSPSATGSRADARPPGGTPANANEPAASQAFPAGTAAEEGRLSVETEYRFPPAAPAPVPPQAKIQTSGAGAPIPVLARGYWLQLGAFSTAGNAGAARERLTRQVGGIGAPLDVVSADGLFKLQAGPWPTRDAARAAAERVRAASELKPFAIER